jgi:hypothetical protein
MRTLDTFCLSDTILASQHGTLSLRMFIFATLRNCQDVCTYAGVIDLHWRPVKPDYCICAWKLLRFNGSKDQEETKIARRVAFGGAVK